MTRILNFNDFIILESNEQGKIYTKPGDPYEYKVINNVWMTKGKGMRDWTSLENNKEATEKLDSRHPEARIKTSGTNPTMSNTTDSSSPIQNQNSSTPLSGSTMICSHAGMWDGSGASKAENCLKNIEENIKAKTDMVEIDIQITADGVPVLFHDSTLDKKTNSRGKIQNMNWNDVKNISYKSDPSQRICSLQEVVNLIKKYSSKTILQLDKCDSKELAIINSIGILKGIENQVVAKGLTYAQPSIVNTIGIKWMPILPTSNVGGMSNKQLADSLISKATPGFFEYQFSDSDTYIVNGYISDSLRAKGVYPMVVAVGGTKNTNGASYRGDSRTSWEKIIKNINPSFIMTNKPNQLKSYLSR